MTDSYLLVISIYRIQNSWIYRITVLVWLHIISAFTFLVLFIHALTHYLAMYSFVSGNDILHEIKYDMLIGTAILSLS